MCGIIGYVGKRNAIPILIDGLKSLEYRGYDSAGIAYIKEKEIIIKKEKGKIINLEKILNNDESHIGIGHTRWATHGVPNTINSHPHTSGDITLVHNGIIENYESLKEELTLKGYKFTSDTDSEVAAAYLDYLYKKEKNILKAITKCQDTFRGSYALGIIVNNDFEKIYALRKDSPLIIGISEDGNFIASDMPAIIKYTKRYILPLEKDIAVISASNVQIYHDMKEVKRDIHAFDYSLESAEKGGFEYFMLKEINEEEKVTKNLVSYYMQNNNLDKLPDLSKYSHIDIVACGSAYHAGLIGKYLLEEFADIPVNVEIASEYRYKKLFIDEKTLVIAISQSGETADTLASIRIAKSMGATTLGIINVVGSSIARETDYVLYTNAGPEIAVATTKAYLLQVLTLVFMAYKMMAKDYHDDFEYLSELLNKLIHMDYKAISKELASQQNVFFIGRNIDYATAMEGSLKLKEISYIHSETYAAGELKHGSISLISEGTWVIAIVTKNSIAEKTISNIKEVKARGAKVLLITTKDLLPGDKCFDEVIIIPNTVDILKPILAIIPLQLIAYEVAKLKGYDIDKPRNLAKSVTVE